MFVLAFDNTDNGAKKVERNSHTKYFLPRVNISNYNVLIDGRNFYDQPINDERLTTRLERLQQDKERMFVRLSVLQRFLPTNCSWSK